MKDAPMQGMKTAPMRQQKLRQRLAPFHLVLVSLFQATLIVLMVHQPWRVWNNQIIGMPGDSSIYLWFLSWWGHSLAHGSNLAVTHLVTYPWGNNILWDTSMPLVFIPLSLLYHGRVLTLSLSYNVAVFSGWWFSAIAAYYSYFSITGRRVGSAIGATLTMTSAYFTNQALGHTDLMWVGFSFLLFSTVFRYAKDSRSLSWLLWRMVPLLICQWLTNEEYFVTTQVMIGLALYLPLHDALWGRRQWRTVGRMLAGYAMGLVVSTLVLSPVLAWQIFSPDQPLYPFAYFNVYQLNLVNLVVPVHTWLHLWPPHLTGNVMEQDGYFGLVFLIGFAVFFVLTRGVREQWHRRLIYWTAMLLLLSMGDFLLLNAKVNTHIPLPGVVFSILPVFRSIIFDRFMWGVFWGCGLLVSIYFHQLRTTPLKLALAVWSILVVISWWPQAYPTTSLSPNRWITQRVSDGTIHTHEVLLVFPYDVLYNPNNNVLGTQIANHFRYRLAEGYLSPNDALLDHFRPLISYWTVIQLYGFHSQPARIYGSLLKDPGLTFHHFLTATRPGLVVLTPMPHEGEMKQWLVKHLGTPSGQAHNIYYWHLTPPQ